MSIQPRGEPSSVESRGSKPNCGLLAPGPDELRVLLVHAVGGGRVGQVRDPVQQLVALAAGRGLLGLGRGQLLLELAELLDLLRARRAALGRPLLRGPQRLGALGMRPPADVGRQQRVEVLLRAPPGESGPVPVGILPCSLEVNHGRESSRAASTGQLS